MDENIHETMFLEVEAEEAIWMRYAAAYASNGHSPLSAANLATELLELHRQVWTDRRKKTDELI